MEMSRCVQLLSQLDISNVASVTKELSVPPSRQGFSV